MGFVVLVAPAPKHGTDAERLDKFAQALGPLPVGVSQVAQNVWLIDTEARLDFLLKFARIAEEKGQDFQGYNSVPRPASA
jgi:hypothetical protein